MQAADVDIIKDIPGYKVILKTVLKSQIQLLVQQLADQTGEESVILTASLSDGTLSHLGSESGKVFLEGHEDIKSQFLGFCLKRYHRQKQIEKEKEEQSLSALRPRFKSTQPLRQAVGPRPRIPTGRIQTSPRQHYTQNQGFSPTVKPSIHPVSLSRASSRGGGSTNRHEPYPQKQTSSFDNQVLTPSKDQSLTLPVGLNNNEVIKIEALDEQEETNSGEKENVQVAGSTGGMAQKDSDNTHDMTADSYSTSVKDMSSSISVSVGESDFKETKPLDMPPQRELSLDSNLSNSAHFTSDEETSASKPVITTTDSQTIIASSDIDPSLDVKVEAITESEMELEITGVEPGHMTQMDDSWLSDVSSAESFNPAVSGFSSQGDTMADQLNPEYNPRVWTVDQTAPRKRGVSCSVCDKIFRSRWYLDRHMLIHTGEKPFVCQFCKKRFNLKHNLKTHMIVHLDHSLRGSGKSLLADRKI